MIKTQHMRLDHAAERLGVDVDKLLLFAAEGGIQLYGLLNDWRFVTAGKVMITQDGYADEKLNETPFFDILPVKKYFTFVRVDRFGVSRILKDGEAFWEGGICTDPDKDGIFWETAVPTSEVLDQMRGSNPRQFKFAKKTVRETSDFEDEFEIYRPEAVLLRREDLFSKTGDIENIISGQSVTTQDLDKEPQLGSPQRRGGITKIVNSHLKVIGGLLLELGSLKRREISAKEVRDLVIKSGSDISENNVREIMKSV